jgi:hypothetical protein
MSTAVFLSSPPVQNVISIGSCKTTVSEKVDFYWPLALATLKTPVQIALGPLL